MSRLTDKQLEQARELLDAPDGQIISTLLRVTLLLVLGEHREMKAALERVIDIIGSVEFRLSGEHVAGDVTHVQSAGYRSIADTLSALEPTP